MAVTATTASLAPYLYDDKVIPVSASGVGGSTATVGDWVAASANWAMPATEAFIGSPAYKVSGLGIAAANNPTFNSQGVAINNSAFAVIRRGVFRVSAGESGSARTIPIGTWVYPDTTASGIVGTTGATGVNAQWLTAPPRGISANPTGAIASGVAQIINHPVGGDSGLGQIDIVLNLATNNPYF